MEILTLVLDEGIQVYLLSIIIWLFHFFFAAGSMRKQIEGLSLSIFWWYPPLRKFAWTSTLLVNCRQEKKSLNQVKSPILLSIKLPSYILSFTCRRAMNRRMVLFHQFWCMPRFMCLKFYNWQIWFLKCILLWNGLLVHSCFSNNKSKTISVYVV